MVSVLFALLTALFNGLASVLQRMAAATAPAAKALHLSLFGYLIRHKVWLAGIGMVILAAVCQATALATGPVALVQPIFIIELPFTLLVASKLARRKLPRMTWWAVGLVTVALGAGLAAAAPSGGGTNASPKVWATALIVTGIFEAVVITIGVRAGGNTRAATFGLAAACGYALTATLMKSAVAALPRGIGPFFSSWQLYATAVAGVGALFLLQNALQAGSLVAVQPPLTLGDALISACYGVTVFGENVQTAGWLLAAEIVAVIAVTIGCIELSRSLALVHVPQPAELAGEPAPDHRAGAGWPGGRLGPARLHLPLRRSPGRASAARSRGCAGWPPSEPASGCRPVRPGRSPACGRTRRCPSESGRSRVRPVPAARRCRRESRTRCR